MLGNGSELLSRYLPGILARNPGLAEKISAVANPAAATLAAVKNSDEYAYDLKAEASEAARTSARMGEWFKTAPLSDFSAYVEKVKNGTAEDYAPWNSTNSLSSQAGGEGSRFFARNEAAQSADDNFTQSGWQKVKATREGLVGCQTASGCVIGPDDIFVALPDRSALGKTVQVYYKGQLREAPVLDVGPFNTKDPY